ncbi:MAG TPA: mycothiol synthase, partial [Marmoricola sp.]|nr:mycothiol synthase [Marmoricola sp.]
MAPEEISAEQFATLDSSTYSAELRRIGEACDAADGVITLNEQACLQLKYRGLRDARLWISEVDGTAAGFALLHGGILDLAVHPDARGQGIGSSLAQAALAEVERVEAWSHADHPAAARIAARFGLPRERDLRIMSRPTSDPVEIMAMPAGIGIRTFTPEDEEALLAINAHAFATHPEQGHMSVEDFRERTSETWFDPFGLFLAVSVDDPSEVLGFHWTKVHRDEKPPYGEVYVVAVSPKAAGKGLGTLLTQVGLA